MSSAAGFNHYNRAGMTRAGMEDWQQAFGFKSLFDGFTTSTPASSSMGLLRAIHGFHAARAGLTALSRPALPHRPQRLLYPEHQRGHTQVEKTFPAERVCNYQGVLHTFNASNHAVTSSSTQVPTSSACLRAWRGSKSEARMSPDARTAAGSFVPWVRDDTFLQGAAWRESPADGTSALCASAAMTACCCWSSAWAR